MEEQSTSQYSLWLLPDAGDTRLLEMAMEQVNEALPGPTFVPHLTLLDRLVGDEADLVEKVIKLSDQLSAFSADPEKLILSQYYFRALYVRLKASPDLLRCRQLASETYELRMDKSFKPHISLLYSAASRDRKAEALRPVHLTLPESYHINRVALIRTALAIADWEIIRELPMVG